MSISYFSFIKIVICLVVYVCVISFFKYWNNVSDFEFVWEYSCAQDLISN